MYFTSKISKSFDKLKSKGFRNFTSKMTGNYTKFSKTVPMYELQKIKVELLRVGYSILHFQNKITIPFARSSYTFDRLFLGRWRRAAAQSIHIQGFWITLKGLEMRSDQSSTLGAPKISGCLNYYRTSYVQFCADFDDF